MRRLLPILLIIELAFASGLFRGLTPPMMHGSQFLFNHKKAVCLPRHRRYQVVRRVVSSSSQSKDDDHSAPKSFPNLRSATSDHDRMIEIQYLNKIKELAELFSYDLYAMYQLSPSYDRTLNRDNFTEFLYALGTCDDLPIDDQQRRIVEVIGYLSLNSSYFTSHTRTMIKELHLINTIEGELINLSTKATNSFGETNDDLLKTLAFGLYALMIYAPDDMNHVSLMRKVMARLVMTNHGGSVRKFLIYALYHIPATTQYFSVPHRFQMHDLFIKMLLTATSSALISAWLREEYLQVYTTLEQDFIAHNNKAVTIALHGNQLMWAYEKVFLQNETKFSYLRRSSWWDSDIYDIPTQRSCFFFFNTLEGGVVGMLQRFSDDIRTAYDLEEC